ncbi:Glutathione S-transferase lancl1, variant 2 [Clonorchis sinensis]|uniref:Glutathione S-transferase lancl1, variant 2 n=1 Tax=Clonorchis sinensis TaxID=79923 RepID=A0A8T1MD05_CLOSI|nr:Glutathione S-transferase lancl1, variant 2 [Clonorchis sinensis]
MVDVSDDRHFTNPFDAWNERFKVDDEWKRSLSEKIVGLVNKLSEEASNLSSSDISMYTGLAGIGLFFLKLSRAPEAFIDHTTREDARNFSQKITRRCLRHVDTDRLHKNVSVFTSSVGALCLAALDESDSAAAEKYLEQILACAKFACDLNSSMPDEALYGRSGYINALLTLGRENRQIPANVLAGVVDAVLQSGLRTAKRYQSDGIYRDLMRHSNLAMPPLMYEWHDKTYLGGAHGFAGILLTLIKVSLTLFHVSAFV